MSSTVYKNLRNGLALGVICLLFTLGACNNGSRGSGSTASGSGGGGKSDSPAMVTLSMHVVDDQGNPVTGFYWTLEEDNTLLVVPGVKDNATSVTAHIEKSFSRIVGKGKEPTAVATAQIDPTKRYYVSALPTDHHFTMSGMPIKAGQTDVTVHVHTMPIPTAMISVFVFEDNAPINAAIDQPGENGIPGFQITVYDHKGLVSKDAFNNPIGTEYQQNPDGTYFLDANGMPVIVTMGTGVILSDAGGEALVKNMPPDNYIIYASPPPGTDWVQTNSLEGSMGNDAWVKAGEPKYSADLGFLNWLVFYGFVHPMQFPAPTGTVGEVTGQVVYVHDNKPPAAPGLNPGPPVPNAWVGLNDLSGADNQVYTAQCDSQGNFDIKNIPPGRYELAMWDLPVHTIIDYRTFVIPPTGGLLQMGPVPVFGWYANLQGHVFMDTNQNGYMDPGEEPIQNVLVNIRSADGSILYQTVTDPNGFYYFNEIVPIGKWLVAEVDSSRLKPTGITTWIDDGGPLPYPGALLNPQPQVDSLGNPIINPNTGDNLSRTETGDIITQAVLLQPDMTSIIDWGKVPYAPNETAPIRGDVHYDTTRDETDIRFAVTENWEPGIPHAQVNLYQDSNFDGIIDDVDHDGHVDKADVDNYPFGWSTGGPKGPEDVDWNGDGIWEPGDAIQIVWTDSWDDNLPDAVGPVQYINGQPIMSGAETFKTWEQVRDGLFDGTYTFDSYYPGGISSGSLEVHGLPPGYYIVESSNPWNYTLSKPEDQNIGLGETFVPYQGYLMPWLGWPPCVGDPYKVPAMLSLFPDLPAPYAGQTVNLCDKKEIFVTNNNNPITDFSWWTEAPRAARSWGWVSNDMLLEFDPASPNFSSNAAPSWLPVSFKDWDGTEVNRVYTDQWGRFDALLPSNYTVDPPNPVGFSPKMIGIFPNDIGPIPDPLHPGQTMYDPWFNPGLAREFLESWDYWPGVMTSVDTIVIPIAAFSANKAPIDCEFPDGTPTVKQVSYMGAGPYVAATPGNITIDSRGSVLVPNPAYDPSNPLSQPTVARDFGFGTIPGTVMMGSTALAIVSWSDSQIVATVASGAQTAQLSVIRGDNGLVSIIGLTVHVAGPNYPQVIHVTAAQSIQAAIDSANDHALILIDPGIHPENPVMYKPIKLQGWGAFVSFIDTFALMQDPFKQQAWIDKVNALTASGDIVIPPGSVTGVVSHGGVPGEFGLERFAGVAVTGSVGRFTGTNPALVDGLNIMGAQETGGGIQVFAYAPYLHISNNRLWSNEGAVGGGVRIGTPSIVNTAGNGYTSSENQNIVLHNNQITENGSLNGGGGGIAAYKGSDNCLIQDNWICGNYALNYGGGIQIFGQNDNILISRNKIFSNQSGDEGAGVALVGELVLAGQPASAVTEGVGHVVIDRNDIEGNLAGDDGGGILALLYNGQDVQANPSDPTQWYELDIFNNFIINNSSADAGGGIALDDAAKTYIINNTIARNDSTATGSDAFGGVIDENNVPAGIAQLYPPEAGEPGFLGGLSTSVAQVGGIEGTAHSTALQASFGAGHEQTYSNPVLYNNIIYKNRTFFWDATCGTSGCLRPDLANGETAVFWDMAVTFTPTFQKLNPMYCLLTGNTVHIGGNPGSFATYDASNVVGNPNFIYPYWDIYEATSKGAAFGNFVVTTFTPNGMIGNYRFNAGSPAINIGNNAYMAQFPLLHFDVDGNPRPSGGGIDAGAYQKP